MLIPFALFLQVATIPAGFGTLQRPGGISTDGHEIFSLCGVTSLPPTAELEAREDRLADSVKRQGNTPVSSEALACTRALLALGDVTTSKGGILMPDGGDWARGGINVLLKAAAIRPLTPQGFDLLAALYLRNPTGAPFKDVARLMAGQVDAGSRSRLVLRACTAAAMRNHDAATSRRCAGQALAVGVDSTWHLLQWARERFLARDTVGGVGYFQAAVKAAGDSVALAEVNWHLQWFLSPAEMATWKRTTAAQRLAVVQDILSRRDITDARPKGSRLAEHFDRLEFVEKNFATAPARVLEGPLRTGAPAGWNPNDQSFRDAQRWQSDIDDRGVVWMRFGAPPFRLHSTVRFCAAGPQRCKTPMDSALNMRLLGTEDWTYRFQLDTFPMRLRFQEEWFDGSAGATTLKGSRALLSRALSADDNTRWTDHAVRLAAQLYRIWDPVTSEPVALVAYGVALDDLLKSGGSEGKRTDLGLTLRQWDPEVGVWRDSSLKRSLLIPKKSEGDFVVGSLSAPSSPGMTSWSLAVEQPKERVGQKFETRNPVIRIGRAAVSDLVVGAASQGLMWQRGDQTIALGPQGNFDRAKDIALFFQILAADELRDIQIAVTINRPAMMEAADTIPALRVAFTETVPRGIQSYTRHLDLSRIAAGNYTVSVTVASADGAVLARRSGRLTLR